MTVTADQVLLGLAVLLPFVVAADFGISHIVRKGRPNYPSVRDGVSLLAAIVTFIFVVWNLPAAFAGASTSVQLLEIYPGFSISLRADFLGLLFATVSSFLWIITTVYSIGYMRGLHEHSQTRYFACFAAVIGAAIGVAMSANLFSLLVFYEVLTVATYPLVVHHETDEAYRAGRKYLVYTLGGGGAIIAAMAIVVGLETAATPAGLPVNIDLSFAAGGNAVLRGLLGAHPEFTGPLQAVAALLIAGFGVKSTLVPLHGWLPSAMVAPTPVSGLLHAVAVVKAGVFGELRTVLFFLGPLMITLGVQPFLILFAAATILFGSLMALVQDNLKARLAYSTISQLSYIVLGAALLTPNAVIGAAFMIAAHAFAKLTMFFVAGAILVETGKTQISQLDGIGKRMPRTMAMFTLATLGMAALPPMSGFVAKWYLGIGAWEANQWPILIVLVASSVLNLAYFLPIVIRAFLRDEPGTEGLEKVERREARGTLSWPLTATGIGALILGLWTAIPYGPFDLARSIAFSVKGAFPAALQGYVVPVFSYLAQFNLWVPPFLIFLIGLPIVYVLKGRARQAALVAMAGVALVDVLFMPASAATNWTLPFLDGQLVLMNVDRLSLFTGYIFAIITFLAVLYASVFVKNRGLHIFALLYAATSMGAVFAGDWVTLIIFWELMAITSTLLIWQNKGEAVGAGYRYFLFHGFGGAMLAAGAALAYLNTGTLSLIPPATAPPLSTWAIFFLTVGMGVNAAFILLHTWLPDAYPKAHVAASVFLSVYTTKTAVYAFARLFTMGNWAPAPAFEAIAFMGAIMAVYGVTFAVFQNNMRKLLSYHIVSQVGYMIAGVGIAGTVGASLTSPDPASLGALALDGGMAHVFNHILYKALLFMTIGVVIWKTGEQTMDKLGGLWKKMPVTAIAFWVAAFSISGVPLFNGFVSKGMVVFAAEEYNTVLWILLEIASFGTFLSFLKLGWFTFIRPVPAPVEASDPPWAMRIAMAGTAALCILLGVLPGIQFAVLPIANPDYQPYALMQVLSALVVLGLAALFFFTVGRKVLAPHTTRLKDADVAYVAGGQSIAAISAGVDAGDARFYDGFVRGVAGVGRGVRRLQTGNLNWNNVGLALGLALVLVWLLWGVI